MSDEALMAELEALEAQKVMDGLVDTEICARESTKKNAELANEREKEFAKELKEMDMY